MVSDGEARKPNMFVVLVAGLLCPGAGLVAAGRVLAGVVIAGLFVAAAVMVPVVALSSGLPLHKLPGLVRAASVALWAPSAVFGVVAAALSPLRPLRPVQHPWWLLGVVLLTWVSRVAVSERLVGEHVVTFVTPTEGQLRAVAPPDADVRGVFVVAKRRVELAEVVPDAWVVVRSADGVDVAHRVTKVDRGVQLDDGRTVELAALRGVGVLAR